MSTKYEYNDAEPVRYVAVAGDTWYCHTFTPQTTHNITLVKLFVFTDDVVPSSDVVIGIQNATGDDNHPDGTDITSGTFSRDELTTDEASEWKEITLTKYRVVKDTTYAIVLRMPDATKPEVVNWWFSVDGDIYPRGLAGISEDGGVTWDMEVGAEYDFLFEEWGDPVIAHRHHPTIPTEPNRGKILSGMGSLKAPFLYTEEQTAYDVEMWLCPTYFFRSGQYLTISNRVVSKLSFPLRKDGEPTGDVTFTIRRVFDDSILASKVWGDASALSTSTTWENVTFDTPVLINEQVRILAEFYGGDEDNHVVYHLQSNNVKADEYSTYYDGSYYDDEEQDGPYIYTYRKV